MKNKPQNATKDQENSKRKESKAPLRDRSTTCAHHILTLAPSAEPKRVRGHNILWMLFSGNADWMNRTHGVTSLHCSCLVKNWLGKGDFSAIYGNGTCVTNGGFDNIYHRLFSRCVSSGCQLTWNHTRVGLGIVSRGSQILLIFVFLYKKHPSVPSQFLIALSRNKTFPSHFVHFWDATTARLHSLISQETIGHWHYVNKLAARTLSKIMGGD